MDGLTAYQVLSLVGIPTLMTLIITFVWNLAVNGTKKTKARRDKEREGAIRLIVRDETGGIMRTTVEIKEHVKLLGAGTQASLRNDILSQYYACRDKGFRTSDDSENFRDMHSAYHALGGNSFIDSDVVPAFEAILLSEKKPEKRRKKPTKKDV